MARRTCLLPRERKARCQHMGTGPSRRGDHSIAGGTPTFKGYHGFPATICASVNEKIVHGIPSKKRILQDGDVFSLDVGCTLNGMVADAALTVPIGTVAPEVQQLLDDTQRSLFVGIEAAVVEIVFTILVHPLRHSPTRKDTESSGTMGDMGWVTVFTRSRIFPITGRAERDLGSRPVIASRSNRCSIWGSMMWLSSQTSGP